MQLLDGMYNGDLVNPDSFGKQQEIEVGYRAQSLDQQVFADSGMRCGSWVGQGGLG